MPVHSNPFLQVDSVDAASTQTTHEHQAFRQYEREFKALRTKNRALRERAAELQRTVDAYQGLLTWFMLLDVHDLRLG